MTASPPLPAAPHSWWTVAEVSLEIEPGGPALYYRRGPRAPIRDEHGRWRRDTAGRTALEAFGALPLADMYRRLAAAGETDRPMGTDDRPWLVIWPELREYVLTFGPLGFEWARTFYVENPADDRALGRRAGRRWRVVFPAPGYSRATVQRADHPRKWSWADRVRFGDTTLPHDFLGLGDAGPLWNHQDDLRRGLDLVKALADDPPNPHRIRTAGGALPRVGGYDVADHGVRDPIDRRWLDAIRPPRGTGAGEWSPFEAHPTHVDWPVAGRLLLAEYLSEQLAWSRMDVGLDERGRFRSRWTPRSLLDIIYLQLLEHVEQRLQFGVGECPLCRGPILRTRASERTRNRAHHGCANVLRKRRQRDRQRCASAPDVPA